MLFYYGKRDLLLPLTEKVFMRHLHMPEQHRTFRYLVFFKNLCSDGSVHSFERKWDLGHPRVPPWFDLRGGKVCTDSADIKEEVGVETKKLQY